jgi:hypothetical protein
MTTSVRLHRRTCVFERQDVGIYDRYDTDGTAALWPRKAPGPAPRLSPAQHQELTLI